MITLYDSETGKKVGELTPAQFDFLASQFEEESVEDQGYYLSRDEIDYFEEIGAEANLLAILRQILGDRDGMEFRWQRG